MITKAMISVTRDVIRRYVIDKLLPHIKAKCPAEDRHSTIWILDNCRTNIAVDDPELHKKMDGNSVDVPACKFRRL